MRRHSAHPAVSLRTPLVLGVAAALVSSGCSGGGEGRAPSTVAATLTVKGSDTMVILAQKWAEAFMDAHPGAAVQVSGGGSGTGVASLINGTTTLANMSRPIEDTERAQVREARGVEAVPTAVAIDAIAIYVHRDNPIESLSATELRAMFRGRVESWRDVGPDLGPVVLYSRENNSGTYGYFKHQVLDDHDFAPEAQTLPGTAAVINAVSLDPRGIGYGGIAYAEGVRLVPIATAAGPVLPTRERALDGSYPLARSLFIVSAGPPEGISKSFLEFALSDDGQALVDGVGYFPLNARDRAPTEATP